MYTSIEGRVDGPEVKRIEIVARLVSLETRMLTTHSSSAALSWLTRGACAVETNLMQIMIGPDSVSWRNISLDVLSTRMVVVGKVPRRSDFASHHETCAPVAAVASPGASVSFICHHQ